MGFFRRLFGVGGGRRASNTARRASHREEVENNSHESTKQTDHSSSALQSDLDSHASEWGQERYDRSLQFWTNKSTELSRRCHVLEEEARQREIEERYANERIKSLEKQLERLLAQQGGARGRDANGAGDGDGNCCRDISSSPLRKSMSSSHTVTTAPLSPSTSLFTASASQEFAQDDSQASRSDSFDFDHEKKSVHDSRQEISSLEELLSKVLAENKVLTSKCENLTSILKDRSTSNNSTSLPPDITDLDSVLALNKSCTPHVMAAKRPFIYHLRCRKCTDFHYIGQTPGDIKLKVDEHFDDVWRKVLDNRRPGSARFFSTEFGRSAFVQHIAHHNRKAKSRDEVRKWCKENVRIAILKGEDKKINVEGWLLLFTLLDAAEKERDEAVADADGPQNNYTRFSKDLERNKNNTLSARMGKKSSNKMTPPQNMSFFS